MNPREMVRLAKSLAGRSEKDADEALTRRNLDATERLSVKVEINAQAAQRELNASLATDDAEYSFNRPPANETQRLLVKVGFRLGHRYESADVDRMLQGSGYDPTQKIACRLELREMGMVAAATEEPRQVFSMRASADGRSRGKVLRNGDGTPRTLRFA